MGAVLIASTEAHAHEKGVKGMGPKVLAVVHAPGKGSQEARCTKEIEKASNKCLPDAG